MITVKRLLCVLLTLATLSATAALSASSADGAAQVTVCKVQRLTAGTTFDPDTAPEIASAAPGDVVVLTIEFRNNSANTVNAIGIAAKIFFDATKVTPYKGTSPFSKNPYRVSPKFADDYAWEVANTGFSKDDYVMLTAAGTTLCPVQPGAKLVLGYMAFRVNDGASGAAEFTFDVAGQQTSITDADQKVLTPDVSPFRLTLGGYAISDVTADHVTLTNPDAVRLAVMRFDAAGKFLSAEVTNVPANAGTVSLATAAAARIRAVLMDGDYRPLCVYG